MKGGEKSPLFLLCPKSTSLGYLPDSDKKRLYKLKRKRGTAMAKKNDIPNYGMIEEKGYVYYRTRVKDADGKTRTLKAKTPEELYEKECKMRDEVEDILFRRANPTVREYCEKWLKIQEGKLTEGTLKGYRCDMKNYIVNPLGDMYLSDVRSDDIQLAMIRVSKKSEAVYNRVNMLFKCIFYSAERSELIDYNPSAKISAKGGKPAKERVPLTDEQVKVLLDTVRELPPYVFSMIALYSGLRREEILGLKWDCVFLDAPTPYISVRRAWRSIKNRPVVTEVLKTPAAKRDIPIPKKLVECLREQKAKSISDYVIADSNGEPLSYSQFDRVWKYVKVRSTKERFYYKYVNGQAIRCRVKHELGECQKNNPKIVATIDFDVTPHVLRHTYITNLIYDGVDPKTVQYLAGHENSKTTMDIYAKVKYNNPKDLIGVVNEALKQ